MSASRSIPFALSFLLILVACGASRHHTRDPILCTPGATQLCLCSATAHGAQTCDADGRRWGPCRRCEYVEYGEEAWFDDMEDEEELDGDCGFGCGCVSGIIGTMGVGGLGVIGAGSGEGADEGETSEAPEEEAAGDGSAEREPEGAPVE
jgi:hypothetical protein